METEGKRVAKANLEEAVVQCLDSEIELEEIQKLVEGYAKKFKDWGYDFEEDEDPFEEEEELD